MTAVSGANNTHMNINVSWESPTEGANGYAIYYQTGEGPVINEVVTGGEIETHTLKGLQRGVSYNISIVALSQHLPSARVGPITLGEKSYAKLCYLQVKTQVGFRPLIL